MEVQGLGNERDRGDVGAPRYPFKLYIMRNKELFRRKLDSIIGKSKTIKVMATRRGTTTQDVHAICDQIEALVEDLNTMIEREQ